MWKLKEKTRNLIISKLWFVLGIVLCCSFVFSFFVPLATVQAFELRNSFRLSDPDTTDSYKSLLINDMNGSRYAGKIWSDKSVLKDLITLDMDTDGYDGTVSSTSDFLHVYSTLGSSIQQNNYSKVPVDLVIAIDMSASMAQDTRYEIDQFTKSTSDNNKYADANNRTMKERIENSRIQKTLDAVNQTIDYLMKQNINNRVSVVVYGAGAAVIMPLSHYKRVNDNTPYLKVGGMETLYSLEDLTFDENLGWLWTRNLDACYTIEVKAYKDDRDNPDFSENSLYTTSVSNNVKNDKVKANPGYEVQNETNLKDNSHKENNSKDEESIKNDHEHYKELKAEKYVGYFTNTQGGIYLAYSQLASEDNTTITVKTLTNKDETLARIPAAIIMTDGGANFAFNEMDNWQSNYGASGDEYDPTSWNPNAQPPYFRNDDSGVGGFDNKDKSHRLTGTDNPNTNEHNVGDEWYKVYLPGVSDKNEITSLYNSGMENEKGTLNTQPEWAHAGILYSSDNDILGTSGTVLQVLMTASYMKTAAIKHYEQGWEKENALDSTRLGLSTYTMSVDAKHVPQWGKFRLYPTMDPTNHPLINDSNWWDDVTKFGPELTQYNDLVKKSTVFNGMINSWNQWKSGGRTDANMNGSTIKITIMPLSEEGDSTFGVTVTNQDVIENIAYNDGFYDVESQDVDDKFLDITSKITDNIFIPISGVNEDGVSDSLTYNDPIGKYMEIKDNSITVKDDTKDNTYDMAMLLFGEMHGIVKTGIYDYNFNATHRGENHNSSDMKETFTMGWYDKNGNYLPAGGSWNKGDTYYLDAKTIKQYVPTIEEDEHLTDEEKNKTYVIYRFADSTEDRNKEVKNISYGEQGKVTFKLSDIRLWIEKDKSRETYNDMLYVNIPVKALPLQTVSIQVAEDESNEEVESYKTNLENKQASTPLRLFYGVGLATSIKVSNLDLNLNKIDDKYKNANTKDGYLYFYSNYFSNTLYEGYTADTQDAARTRGDAVTTFSPSEDNRYYVFQKNLPLYSKAYTVQQDGSLKEITDEEAKTFTGANYYGELKEETGEGTRPSVKDLIDNGSIKPGDVVTFSGDKVAYSSNPASDTYYFIAIDYYVPNGEGKGKKVQTMVSRLGKEFGSGILGDEVASGEYLCWYDETGKSSKTYNYNETISEEELKGENKWILGTKIGGLRIGDLHQGVQKKSENTTETSKSYYLPLIAADKSRAGYDAVLDGYLGNNGVIRYRLPGTPASDEDHPDEPEIVIPNTGENDLILYLIICTVISLISLNIYKRKILKGKKYNIPS